MAAVRVRLSPSEWMTAALNAYRSFYRSGWQSRRICLWILLGYAVELRSIANLRVTRKL